MIDLPHELAAPGKEHLHPITAKGDRLRSYRVTYDPEIDGNKKGKAALRSDLHQSTADPRDKSHRRKPRREVRLLSFRWDQHSTRPKPPPPAHSVVISGLSPLTTIVHVRQHLRVYGRINNVDLKLDPGTGMSTGVCHVDFVHDYDDDLKIARDAKSTDAQRGDLVARTVLDKCNGQRIGNEVVGVALDDASGTLFRKTYRELIAKRLEAAQLVQKEAAQRALNTTAAVSHNVTKGALSPSATPYMRPPPEPPRPLRSIVEATTNGRNGHSSSSSDASPYSRHRTSTSYRRPEDASASPHVRSRYRDEERSDREDPYSRLDRNATDISERDGRKASKSSPYDETQSILRQLKNNDRPYVFIHKIKGSSVTVDAITAIFAVHRPDWIREDSYGWYVAFRGRQDASRAKTAMEGKTVSGYRINVELLQPADAEEGIKRRIEMQEQEAEHRAKEMEIVEKTHWNDEELLKDSNLVLLYELGHAFMSDIRSRVLGKLVTDFLQEGKPGAKLLQAPAPAKLEDLDQIEIDIDLDDGKPKSFNRAAKEEQRQRKLAVEREAARKEREALLSFEDEADTGDESEATTSSKAVKAGTKEAKPKKSAVSKARKGDVEVDRATPDTETLSVIAKAAKKVKRPPSPPIDPFAAGLIEEDEDVYFCRMALELMSRGESASELPDERDPAIEDENSLPIHASGSARTEGFYRIPPAEKGRHLADRNFASDDVTMVITPSTVGLASARDNRADSRRFVQGIEQHKKETATDTDILKFNQLRSRKKQLKFAKSPIHDWGLYAMEMIPAGDMVIEYVGEIVRQQVADEREKTYERQGNFSTYLFRVDDDIVVDATKKGNIARLMNHCCTPNCNAKILTLNGEKRIVLYAKQTILPGQELTYDYKFQASGDEEDAIACLCGSPGCRRFL